MTWVKNSQLEFRCWNQVPFQGHGPHSWWRGVVSGLFSKATNVLYKWKSGLQEGQCSIWTLLLRSHVVIAAGAAVCFYIYIALKPLIPEFRVSYVKHASGLNCMHDITLASTNGTTDCVYWQWFLEEFQWQNHVDVWCSIVWGSEGPQTSNKGLHQTRHLHKEDSPVSLKLLVTVWRWTAFAIWRWETLVSTQNCFHRASASRPVSSWSCYRPDVNGPH